MRFEFKSRHDFSFHPSGMIRWCTGVLQILRYPTNIRYQYQVVNTLQSRTTNRLIFNFIHQSSRFESHHCLLSLSVVKVANNKLKGCISTLFWTVSVNNPTRIRSYYSWLPKYPSLLSHLCVFVLDVYMRICVCARVHAHISIYHKTLQGILHFLRQSNDSTNLLYCQYTTMLEISVSFWWISGEICYYKLIIYDNWSLKYRKKNTIDFDELNVLDSQ